MTFYLQFAGDAILESFTHWRTLILSCSPFRTSTRWCTSPRSWWVVVIFFAFWCE